MYVLVLLCVCVCGACMHEWIYLYMHILSWCMIMYDVNKGVCLCVHLCTPAHTYVSA